MSHLPIWHLGQLTDEVCTMAMASFASDMKDATMGVEGEQLNPSTRRTKVHFAEAGHWLEDVFHQIAHVANQECKWDYEITGAERIQFAQYDIGHHYNWHTDTFTLSGKPEDRKITVVCLLNDEFTGGDFEVRLYQDYKAPLQKGSVIAFPSVLEHRVLPVTKGVRYSATMWFNGPRFR